MAVEVQAVVAVVLGRQARVTEGGKDLVGERLLGGDLAARPGRVDQVVAGEAGRRRRADQGQVDPEQRAGGACAGRGRADQKETGCDEGYAGAPHCAGPKTLRHGGAPPNESTVIIAARRAPHCMFDHTPAYSLAGCRILRNLRTNCYQSS